MSLLRDAWLVVVGSKYRVNCLHQRYHMHHVCVCVHASVLYVVYKSDRANRERYRVNFVPVCVHHVLLYNLYSCCCCCRGNRLLFIYFAVDAADAVKDWHRLRLGVNIDDRLCYAYILTVSVTLARTYTIRQLQIQTLLPDLLFRTLCAPGTMHTNFDKVFNIIRIRVFNWLNGHELPWPASWYAIAYNT